MRVFRCSSLLGSSLLAAIALWLGHSLTGAQAKVFNPTVYTLDNGLQVVVVENHRVPAVVQMLWYKVGSADEVAGYSGLAHFFEHLMFKGTEKTPQGAFSGVVRRNGGNENAFTSWDHTGYYQVVPRAQLPEIMAMEADRMTGLTLSADDIETERKVVLEEWRERVSQNPGAQLGQAMDAALYQNHPYGRPIIGWKREIEALNYDTIRAFYRQHYAPDNAILVVAGDVDPKDVLQLAQQYYGPIPRGNVAPRVRPQEPSPVAARRVTVRDERVREPTWRRAYLAPSQNSVGKEHAYALEVLAQILGDGTVGRLAKSMVRGAEIAAAAGSWYDGDRVDDTSFSLYVVPVVGVPLDKVEAAVDAEIAKLLADGVTDAEVAAIVRRMQAAAVYARDSLQGGARALGEALANGGSVADVESWPDRIAAVTPSAVLEAARLYLRPERSVTGELLPSEPAS